MNPHTKVEEKKAKDVAKKKADAEVKLEVVPPAKNPFAKIQAFVDGLQGLNAEQLRAKLAEVKLSDESNNAAQKADQDLKEQRKKVAVAMEPYAKLRAENRLKTKALIQHLSDGGDEKAEEVVKNEVAAKELTQL